MEVVDHGDAAQVEQVLAGAALAGAAALPVADVGECVLNRYAFAQLGASFRGLLALAQPASSASARWMDTPRPFLLVVQRARSVA